MGSDWTCQDVIRDYAATWCCTLKGAVQEDDPLQASAECGWLCRGIPQADTSSVLKAVPITSLQLRSAVAAAPRSQYQW